MHCATCLDCSNSEQKRRKPVEIKQAKQPLAFCSVFVDGDILWIPVGRTMNRLQSSARKNAVEVLTEDLLWAKGLLGGRNTEDAIGHCSFLQWSSLCTTQWGRTLPIDTFTLPSWGGRKARWATLSTLPRRPWHIQEPSYWLQGCKTMPKVVVRYSSTQNPRDASSLFALTIQWTTHSTCNHRFLQLRPAGTHGNHWVTPRLVVQWLDCANKLAPTTNQTQERLTRSTIANFIDSYSVLSLRNNRNLLF